MGAENAQPPTQKVSEVISTFRPTKLFKAPGLHYTSIDFDDTGELLVLSRTDDTIQIYNTRAGAHAKELKSQKYGCGLARFTHHSQSLLYASTKIDDGLRYLSVHDNSFIKYLRGHTDRVTSLTLCPSNDTFLSASLDHTVKLWDLRSGSPQGNLNLFGAALTAYDPSASVIGIASAATNSVLLYDLRNFDKPPFATFDLLDIEKGARSLGHRVGEGWTSLEFSNNGKSILVGTSSHTHFLLDAFDGTLTGYLYRPAGPPPFPTEINAKDGMPPRHDAAGLQGDACFSPDGRYVLSPSAQHGLLVWDSMGEKDRNNVMKPMTDLPGPKTATVVAYNQRHNLIASAGSDVTLWLPDPDLM
ncbi:hypothetical protein KVT40_001271 [Elsinoe batatas]|uniref:Uncharacterized protein n=1 Tax=Elsinoe batatas TaxID=2601811 RepID=A0A8K0PJF6_9PEZI|nr:hypothetical protein KVT40_001271 [Elsinoe batatas]